MNIMCDGSIHFYHLSSSFDFLGIVIVNKGFLPTFFLLRNKALCMVSISIGGRCSAGSRLLFVRDGGNFMVAPPGATGLKQGHYLLFVQILL